MSDVLELWERRCVPLMFLCVRATIFLLRRDSSAFSEASSLATVASLQSLQCASLRLSHARSEALTQKRRRRMKETTFRN